MTSAIEQAHPGEDLAAYVNGTLDAQRAGALAAHLHNCAICRAEEADWQAVAVATRSVADAAGTAPRGLIDRVWLEIEEASAPGIASWPARLRAGLSRPFVPRFRPGPLGVTAGVAALACFLLVAFAGARADGFFDVFKPKEIMAVPVTLQDIQSLGDLSNYGTLITDRATLSQANAVDTPAAASATAGIPVRTPASVPNGTPSTATYDVLPGSSASFTFSADKARAAAAAQGKALPPMPAGLDGATLQVTTGPVVITLYGGQLASNSGAVQQPNPGLDLNGLPTLVIAQTVAPTVTASGASADDIERYVLSQPGISPQLAGELRALGNPGSVWPIPIPSGSVTSHSLLVEGVKGLAIGDSTGLGAAIVWQKDGEIYSVAGTLTEQELLSVANSLR